MAGPYPYPASYPQQPLPPHQGAPQQYPGPVPSAYPGVLPPPVRYPNRGGKRLLWAVAVALLVAVLVGVVIFATRDDGAPQAAGPLGDASARTAIQSYLDALSNGDDEQIARNALCGLFDAVKEKRSDLALAGLAGDAFRKQFSRAEVTSIDTIVPWSANQAQVLFTMRVTPARGSDRDRERGQQPPNEEEQAVAQLLIRGNEVLVCSYLLRTSQY